MLPKAEPATFVIADITGYTSFLAQTEIDHAQDIVADVMETVVKALRPPFRLAKFEGDAAFLCAAGAKLDASMLQDAIETAYVKFRRRLRDVRQASTCTCKACAAMGDLDLKFVVHHGEMVKQRMGGREELAGRDVILVHRLLKNSVAERTGGRGYALYSDACFEAAGIDPAEQALTEHRETIDIIGETKLWLRDLEAVWEAQSTGTRYEIVPAEAYLTLDYDFQAPRRTIWEHLTVPAKRQQWWPADDIMEPTAKRRRGAGTVNHCMHGKDAIVEELLDWRPFDYFTLSTQLPVPGAPKIIMTRALEDRPNGVTHLAFRVEAPKAKDKEFVDRAAVAFAKNMAVAVEKLREIVAEELLIPAAVVEVEPDVSRGRFLSEPAR
jgi:class 3 adenylate cyclase